MTECITYMESITFHAQLVTVGAVVNIICWAALIYAAIKLRRAAKNLSGAVGR